MSVETMSVEKPIAPGTEISSEPMEVSVVIPCLNEAKSLAFCIDKAIAAFKAQNICGEVVVADNGSTDGSIEIAESCGARVVRVKEKGYGYALQAGIRAARGKFIVMGDADDSYDFGEVPRFLAKYREGFEVVMGNRFEGAIQPGAMPWHHKYIGNPVLSGLLNMLFRSGVGDSHCGMRGFSKETFEKLSLRCTGMEFASEFVIKATQLGARMTEVPITLWPDKRGRPPHLRSFRDGWRHLRFMLMYAPNWLFMLPGVILGSIGMFLVFWLLPGPRQIRPKVILDIHTMVFGVLFVLLGAQIVAIGAFAKVFSYSERFIRGSISMKRWLRRVELEDGLLVGALMFVCGFVGDAHVAWVWAADGFGPMWALREILFWSMWLFLGVQTIFSSFFLSMLGISRGTYIGDYDSDKK